MLSYENVLYLCIKGNLIEMVITYNNGCVFFSIYLLSIELCALNGVLVFNLNRLLIHRVQHE